MLLEARNLLVFLTIVSLMFILYGGILCLCNATVCFQKLGSCPKMVQYEIQSENQSERFYSLIPTGSV